MIVHYLFFLILLEASLHYLICKNKQTHTYIHINFTFFFLTHSDLYGNKLVTLSANVFDSMASLKSLYLGDNMFTTVPTYPAERVTTASSPYFLGGNYLSETQYGLQHACSDHDKNATQCRSILACNYDTIENECNTASSSTITTIPDDTFVYPAPPTIPDDDDDNNNDKSTSGSNSDDDDEWSDDNNIDEWNIKPSQDSDTTLSGSMIAVWVVVAVVGALVLVLLVLLAAVKGRQAHEERQRRRKSEIETPEEREKQAMRDSKRREKDAAKQRKREAKKQRLALEQRRKSRILEIEMEENGAVPMSPAAYSVGSREVDAADVMVLSELGAGTLGAVHKAKLISHRSGGLVAAKLIRLELVADYPTFAAEARRLSELQSPSSSSSPSPSPFLVPVFGVAMYPTPQENTPVGKENEINDNVGEEEEEEDGGGLAEGCGHKCPKSCFCILSEYVPAPNMRQFVWKGNSTDRPLFKLRLCISIARGLQYLHENGALHRDLKPENVLVVSEDPNAEVICRLCDYATAGLKVKETAMDFSRGTGTPQYLAPEVMSGEAQEFSTMADVFSFGVVGFEAFREEAVYSENKFSSNFALMRYVLSGKRPAANDKVAQDCTPDTVALFESCWAQDPSLRPDIPSIISRLEEFASNLNFV